MKIPEPPGVVALAHLSPSRYEAGRVCHARLAWQASGRADEVPAHPKALLGGCYHAVVEAAVGSRPGAGDHEDYGAIARQLFDRFAAAAFARAHELLRVKYRVADRLPYYYLYRERAVVAAESVAGRRAALSSAEAVPPYSTPPRRLIETTLRSSDGLLLGRPDFVDLRQGEVVDYKTGSGGDDATAMTQSEARQLRLYVHLALQNALPVSRGVIVRPGGRRSIVGVTAEQAGAEAEEALEVLASFNQNAGRSFCEVARPLAESCRFCPCIPFCERFWLSATPLWSEACGTHVEGRIDAINALAVQAEVVLTLELSECHGTLGESRAFVEHVPESWFIIGGSPEPQLGDVVRIVDGRVTTTSTVPVVRADRTLTSVWTVRERAADDSESEC